MLCITDETKCGAASCTHANENDVADVVVRGAEGVRPRKRRAETSRTVQPQQRAGIKEMVREQKGSAEILRPKLQPIEDIINVTGR